MNAEDEVVLEENKMSLVDEVTQANEEQWAGKEVVQVAVIQSMIDEEVPMDEEIQAYEEVHAVDKFQLQDMELQTGDGEQAGGWGSAD